VPDIILDSNQPALMSCRAGKGRAGVCRAGATIPLRNLILPTGINAWRRIRAINPAHNATPEVGTWTKVREV
jgi:hypothetical protein